MEYLFLKMKKTFNILIILLLISCTSNEVYEDRSKYCYSDHWGKWDGYEGQAHAEDLITGEECIYTATLWVKGATNWDHVWVTLEPKASVIDYCLYFIGRTNVKADCTSTSLFGTNEEDDYYVTMSVVKTGRDKTAIVNYFLKDENGNKSLVGKINFQYIHY